MRPHVIGTDNVVGGAYVYISVVTLSSVPGQRGNRVYRLHALERVMGPLNPEPM